MKNVDTLDREILKYETGIRALWLLYRRGQWGRLEDFGLDRKVAEPVFRKFENETLLGERLTRTQIRRLVAMVPGLKEAGTELRLAYALRYYDAKMTKEILNDPLLLRRGQD
jgi:hypothetical protein